MTQHIQVLYFKGCPNHQPVVEKIQRLIDVLAETLPSISLKIVVKEIEVTDAADAERLRFLGSPTVQVDGVDIEPAARDRTDFAMSCRVYHAPDGLPTDQMLREALGVASM